MNLDSKVKGAKLRFDIMHGSRQLNDMMRAADLKPDYKVYGCRDLLEVVSDGTKTIRQMFEAMRDGLKKETVLVWICLIEVISLDERYILCPGLLYVDPKVKQVSDGKKFVYVEEIMNDSSMEHLT